MNKEWELTDEEIDKAVRDEDEYQCAMHAIATAAQRKMVEWLEKNDITKREFQGERANEADVLLEKGDLWVDRIDWERVLSALSPRKDELYRGLAATYGRRGE